MFNARCAYCQLYLSPNKFIFHFHRVAGSHYHHPDAANFNSWRRHLTLDYVDPPEELVHAWEDVKAMFNGGSRKRLASSPTVGAKTATSGGADRRQDDSTGRTKRQRVVEDGHRVVTASAAAVNRSSNDMLRPSGFYLQPSYHALTTGPGSSQPQHHHAYTHPSADIPLPTSIQSTSTTCVPYYDVIRMQVLAAAGDAWKARAAAVAAAAVTGVCPLTPPLNVIWPPAAPPADFLSAVGRPRNPLEQFLTMSPSSVGHYRQLNHQRALATFDDVKPLRDGHHLRSRSPLPLPAEQRTPFSAFRLVSDVDDRPDLREGSSIDHDDDVIDVTSQDDINHIEVGTGSGQRLDGNANRCDDNDVPLCDDKQNRNVIHRLIDAESGNERRTADEVANVSAYS